MILDKYLYRLNKDTKVHIKSFHGSKTYYYGKVKDIPSNLKRIYNYEVKKFDTYVYCERNELLKIIYVQAVQKGGAVL